MVAAFLRCGLLIAAYLSTGTRALTQGDTISYLEPGRNLILHGMFSSGGLPEIDRTPGYPLFVMLAGMLFGNVLFVATVQIVLSLLSLLLVYRIAIRVFKRESIGLAAAWLFAVEPLSLQYSVRLISETLFLYLLLLFINWLLKYFEDSKLTVLAWAGSILALATLVRPVGYYLGIFVAAGLLITAKRGQGKLWKAPAIFLVTFLPFIVAWQVRNIEVAGYHSFSAVMDKNLYFFESAAVSAELQGISLAEQQQNLGRNNPRYLEIHPEQQQWTAAQRLNYMHRASINIICGHPALFFKTYIKGFAVVAFSPGAAEFLQLVDTSYPLDWSIPQRILHEGLQPATVNLLITNIEIPLTWTIFEVFLLVIYGFAFVGLLSRTANRSSISILLYVAMYFLLVSGGGQAVGRYRLPVMPELCVLAAGGMVQFGDWMRRGSRNFSHTNQKLKVA